MKTLYVYYSFEGNCRALAEVMAEGTGGEAAGLKLVGGDIPRDFFRKYLLGGMGAFMKRTPAVEPLSVNMRDYDLVVFGSPVWAFTVAPALRGFLRDADLGGMRVGAYVMHRGGKGFALSGLASLLEERGASVVGREAFRDLRLGDGEATRRRAVEWARGMVESVQAMKPDA